jgi:hypothetical protein
MIIEFAEEAGETFDRFVNTMLNFIVELTITDDGETMSFDAELLGADRDAGWNGTVKYRLYNDETGEPYGPVLSAVAERIKVY